MTSPAPVSPIGARRLPWAVADAVAIAGRDVRHWLRQPWLLALGVVFPVVVMLMFAYLLGGSMVVPGGGAYREFLVPGVFAATMFFGLETTVIAVTTDAARGVTDRFRSLPMASSAVVAGRSLADMLHAMLLLTALLACGLAVGWRPERGAAHAAAAVALLLLFRYAVIWVGVFLGLVLRTPEAAVAVQVAVWPLAFLSSVFAPTDAMPAWLGAVAEWNPLSSTAAATRHLFGNPGAGGDSWATGHAVELAVLWPLLLIVVSAPLAVRRYRALRR